MLGRQYTRTEDDYAPCGATGNAEPFRKPDHRAKKHPRPTRLARKKKVGNWTRVFRHVDLEGVE